MNYITVKAFNKKGIDGIFNLAIGTIVTETDNILYYNNKRICFKTSQNAYDHFSRDDDNQGIQRHNLIDQIKNKIAEYVADYNEEIAAIHNGDLTDEEKETELANVADKSAAAYDAIRQDSDTSNVLKADDNLFNFNFYNASILVLNKIIELINNI